MAVQAQPLADYIDEDYRESFKTSEFKDLTVVEPSFADYVTWQNAFFPALDKKTGEIDQDKAYDAHWPAVNAVVRQKDHRVRQFLSEEDFTSLGGWRGVILGKAANSYIVKYLNEVGEKKEF